MKTLSIIILITFFSFTSNLFASNPNPDSTEVVESNRLDVMVLKFTKDQVGGDVVIVDAEGEEVSKMSIKRKRMIIDFDKVNFGSYKIKVLNEGAEVAVFNYNKELIISQVVR